MIYKRKELHELEKEVLLIGAERARDLAVRYKLRTGETKSYCCHIPGYFVFYLGVGRMLGMPGGKIAIKFSDYNGSMCQLQENNRENRATIKYPFFADRKDVLRQLEWVRNCASELKTVHK